MALWNPTQGCEHQNQPHEGKGIYISKYKWIRTMVDRRRRTSVSDTEPTYRVIRPKLTIPRQWSAEEIEADLIPNDIHWAAEIGNINLLADLLMQNHEVNVTNTFGRTPLHEAADNNQLQVADWLMFDGANPHLKDYESCSPMSLCRTEEMVQILSQNSTGRRPEILILLEDTTYHVDNLDIRVITGSTFGPIPAYMMCRRVSPSRSSLRYKLEKGEHFWRDVIEYKVSLVNGWTEISVDILVVDMPPSSSELIVKTEDMNGKIKDVKPKLSPFSFKDNDCWICTITIQLENYGCFALCSRPRSEVMQIPRSGGQVVSRNNNSVKLNVPPQAFRKPGNVLFTIEEAPELEEEESILSMSHFYNMEHSSCTDASEDIEVTLPIPEGYTGEGEIVVLSRPGSTATTEGEVETEEEETWEVKEATVEPEQGSVIFRTNKMGINAPVEVEKGTNRENLRVQTAKLYSKRRECHVKFLVVGKVLGFNQFDIVAECVKSDQIYLRIQEWKTESYTKLRLSGDFISRQNQKYRLELQGNLKCLYGLNDLYLEFLPGQTSHQSLLVTVVNTQEAPNGNIAVHEVKNGGVTLVTQLPVLLQEQLDMSSQMKTEDEATQPKNTSNAPRRVNSFPGDMQTPRLGVREGEGIPTMDDGGTARKNTGGIATKRNKTRNRKEPAMSHLDEVDAARDDLHAVHEDYSRLSLKLDKIPRTPDIKRKDSKENPHRSRNQQVTHEIVSTGGRLNAPSGSIIQSARDTRRNTSRRPSDPSRDCLPAGVGESVTLGGAAASAGAQSNTLQHQHGVSEAVSPQTEEKERSVSSLSQHVSNTGPASENPAASQVQQGISAPVSDNFFVRLVHVMQPNFLIFIPLGLSDVEVKMIQRNTANMDTGYTMFQMLLHCRQKRGDNAAFLHTLLLTLEEFQQNDTKQWVVDWVRQWLRSSPKDQTFANRIRSTVGRFEEG